MLGPIAPGSRQPGGALLSVEGDPVEYRVTYKILPPGVGPDDYEPEDLEHRVDIVDLPQPEDPAYGPAIPEVQRALGDMLDEGAHPIVTQVDRA
jgi:hypothetical protein